jgi:hypothetical protein
MLLRHARVVKRMIGVRSLGVSRIREVMAIG